MTKPSANPAIDSTHTLRRIIDALDELTFGSVEITVHHGRIVQIERREKVRFDKEPRTAAKADGTPTPHVRD